MHRLMRETHRRVMPYLLTAYVLGIAAGFVYFNMRLTVEWVAVILLGAAILSGRGLLFIRDWGVFIAVLLGWQVASTLATRSPFPWHLTAMIQADKFMFGGVVPAVWLQQHLYHPGVLEPWDILAATMYLLHFLAPLLAGFALWMTNRQLFHKFAITFVVVALAGFVTYILYPAVPPWMAAQHLLHLHGQYHPARMFVHHHWVVDPRRGTVHLPGVANLFNVIIAHWYSSYHGTGLMSTLPVHYDQVAAMPSEHAMYPLLFFLFLRKQFGKPAYLALVYIAVLLFSITYLGQHYVIDAIAGFAYAIAGYVVVMHLAPAFARRLHRHAADSAIPSRAAIPELQEA